MIRRVLAEVEAGYYWPDDENRSLYLRGYPPTADFNPTGVERVRRALLWGITELRSELARRIDPDRRG